jgi:hypothetical protein
MTVLYVVPPYVEYTTRHQLDLLEQDGEETMHKAKEKIMLTWCDNGMVDGKFTEGLVYTILTSGLPIRGAQRVQGNQIGRQRQTAFDAWYNSDFDWILWVDSDIHITNDALKKLWDVADAKERPAVSGTYFISKENEQALMSPYPCLFIAHPEDRHTMSYVHPLEPNAIVKVDYAGYGFFLMHRSVADKMKEFHGNEKPFFVEHSVNGEDSKYVSEDIQFFMLMKDAGIPLYGHTGATVKHMKRFSYDYEYYKLFWITHLAADATEKKAEA